MSIDEFKEMSALDLLTQILENNEGVTPHIVADRILNVMDHCGWKIERKL